MIILLTFDTKEDCDKFIFLYKKYLKTVYFTVKRFISDELTIEDLSQEIFIKISKNLDKIDITDLKKTKNYIITIARNLCKNYLRDNSKIDEYPLEYFNEQNIDSGNHLLELIIKKDTQRYLKQEIGKLNEIYQVVLELKYITQFSNDEIADFLHIEKKTVEMRLYRANCLLRERLKDL